MSNEFVIHTPTEPVQVGADPFRTRAPRLVSPLEGYAFWAATYDRDLNPLLALEARELEPLLPDVKGKVVLDVACGTGRWLEKLLERGAAWGMGVDSSRPMLTVASRREGLLGHIVQADMLNLPLRARVADLVLCSFAVEHVVGLGDFAGNLSQVSAPGADVFISEMHPEGYNRGWRCGFAARGENIEIDSVPHSASKLQKAFELEGFDLLRCHEAYFSEPEKSIFIQSERLRLYELVRTVPAVLICHFRLRPYG